MKKYFLIITFVGALVFASCDSSHFVVGTQLSAPVYARPIAPGTDYIWIDGDWIVENGNYVWHEGYWSRPRIHRIWQSGYWQNRNNGWHWQRGRWH